MILPCILKTIWWMRVILDIMDQCDTKVDHIKYIKVSDIYSWSSDFALYIETYLMDEGHTLDNGSVWHKDWPIKIYVGQWPIFRGPVILLNILKTIWWRNIIFGILDQRDKKGWPHETDVRNIIDGIMDQCDTKAGLNKQMWVSDLYFMVQWFCLISWKLFGGCRS